MGATSINIQPCKIGSSEQHNERTKPLDYVRSDLSHLNEHWQSDSKSLSQHLAEVQRAYQDAKGKRMHAKATPIREGVIVIDKTTTMQDLQRFAKACEERWGLKPLQIHTHKDEGYMHAKQWTPNLHAHIVWRWTDEQGVTRKLGRKDMVEMQTLLAETLGMDRGVSSDKTHLNSIQYKAEAEQKRLAELQAKIGDAQTTSKRIDNAIEAQIKPIEAILEEKTTQTLFGGRKTDYEAVIEEIKKQEETKAVIKVSEQTAREQSLQTQVASLQADLIQATEAVKDKDRELNSLARFLRGYLKEEGFEEFKDEAQKFFRESLERLLDLVDAVIMWAGGVIQYKGDRYTADYDNARLLINGKTIEQHLASIEQMHDQEGQRASRGFRK